MRYFIHLAFDGTNFCGWQTQKNDASVQQTIEEALTLLCRTPQAIVGCGRTDTGVHATNYFAHWDAPEGIEVNEIFKTKLNGILPRNIAVYGFLPVSSEANARFDAISRTYHYFVHTRKNPFERHFSLEYQYHQLDIKKMQEAAQLLLNYNEFLPLIKLDPIHKKTKCTLMKSEWEQINDFSLRYTIKANRFLHNMVRRIVGTSLLVGRDKLSIERLKESMDSQTPLPSIYLAAPEGLHLVEIEYKEGVFL